MFKHLNESLGYVDVKTSHTMCIVCVNVYNFFCGLLRDEKYCSSRNQHLSQQAFQPDSNFERTFCHEGAVVDDAKVVTEQHLGKASMLLLEKMTFSSNPRSPSVSRGCGTFEVFERQITAKANF